MARLGEVVTKVRSKNAGPFWLTIDIFCGDRAAFDQVVSKLPSTCVAKALGTATQDLKRFDIPELCVVKFSVPRPVVQGAIDDRDMHGAAWAVLLSEMEIG